MMRTAAILPRRHRFGNVTNLPERTPPLMLGEGRRAADTIKTGGPQPSPYPGVDAGTAAWADDPRFPGAARRLAANLLAASEQDERLGAVFKDAGRYLTALCAAFLDASGGLTQAALKQICGASGYVSPGRARALLGFLAHLG